MQFTKWEAGEITDQEALRGLMDDYTEVEEMYTRADSARKEYRDQISRVVDHAGGKANAGGYALVITAPARVQGYDKTRLDALIDSLLAAGDPVSLEMAGRVAGCRSETFRAGSLQIKKQK